MTTGPILGKLTKMDPRSVWKHEAHDFTRWMADNIETLGEALGIEIDAEVEVPVGAFSVDLAGTVVGMDRRIIIENQLEQTDHSHFGQLMTYAAGTDASIVVWISPKFRDEHRRAIDWLNENTAEGFDVFGVELELVAIGDSLPAPNFKLVAQPNEWAKGAKGAATASAAPSERGLAYKAFFEAALARLKEQRPGFTAVSRVGLDSWLAMSGPRPKTVAANVAYSWSFANTRPFRTELYLDGKTQGDVKVLFDALHGNRASIESAFGSPLKWDRLDNRRASRISATREAIEAADATNVELVNWAVATVLRLDEVFRPIVAAI